ncbi:enhanced intracellular survival protein Eis [uncultured Megasphaera sp.]|uniref:GNAT family N-acetyltransferase n=1 Tax=uncultured Megasphaera sp. TaxID=165188 RepID=UPI0025EDD814|nr:GNAT family N-acetyltransferase [uncultured Megasphaera sp.]
MDFRLASKEDRGLVESLWDYCFEHREDPFFQWYFNNFYQPENVLIGFQDDEMACLTHLNLYTLSLRGKAIDTSYIVGLATHPAARRGGIGGKLLTASLAEMKRRGHYVNILMPSKAGFYQPYGYELYCHQWKETLPLEALRPLTDRTVRYAFVNSSDQWPYLAAVYEGYTKGLSGYALRDEKSWRSHIDAQLKEGNIAVCFDGDTPIGYAFYQLGQPTIVSGEFVYTCRKGKRGLLGYMYNHRSQGEAFQWNEGIHDQSYRFYPDGKSGHETMPFMTGRIVDVKGALEQLPYRNDGTVTFHTEDPLADWNCGTFTLTVTDGRGTVVKETEKDADVTMPIGTLALLVFGAMDISDLAFNEKLKGPDEALSTLQALFPTEKNWINEWY